MSQRQLNKMVSYIRNKRDAEVAQNSSNKFTSKQSQFAKKQEENQIRQEVQPNVSRFEMTRRGMTTQSSFGGGGFHSVTASTGNKLISGSGTRRSQKYNLDAPTAAPADERAGGLLGSSRIPDLDHDGDEAPQTKKSRHEKFEEVISNSRKQRIEQQRERTARQSETTNLDEEFNDVMHLLQRRDRVMEDRLQFEASGNPEVRTLLQSFKASRTAKSFKLTGDGGITATSSGKPIAKDQSTQEKQTLLDDADKALLAKIMRADVKKVGKPAPEIVAPPPENEEDDFDALMGAMRRETKKAHATERTLTEEEEAQQEVLQQQLAVDRGEVPVVDPIQDQLTRGEWLQRGGDKVFRMNDDEGEDNVDIDYSSGDEYNDEEADDVVAAEEEGEVAVAASKGNPVDCALTALEEFAKSGRSLPKADRAAALQTILRDLHQCGRRHLLHMAQSFRMILLDAQKQVVLGHPLSDLTLLLLVAVSQVFPMTDYRHEVVTPYLIFLCSTLMQTKLHSTRDVKVAIILCTLLLQAMTKGNKFCSEAIVIPLNILGLQLKKSVLEPLSHRGTRMPCPMLARSDAALLTSSDGDISKIKEEMIRPVELFGDSESSEQMLFAAYKLLAGFAMLHKSNPAFPCAVAEPVMTMSELLAGCVLPALQETHDAMISTITDLSRGAISKRTPLAMRTFRPRPIRLFEPLLVERIEPEIKEHRELKKELREDKKRLVRHIQAEATVERRAREKEADAEDTRRQAKYNELIGELQAQQHVMKTVDSHMAKSRTNKKKSISGAPAGSEGEAKE